MTWKASFSKPTFLSGYQMHSLGLFICFIDYRPLITMAVELQCRLYCMADRRSNVSQNFFENDWIHSVICSIDLLLSSIRTFYLFFMTKRRWYFWQLRWFWIFVTNSNNFVHSLLLCSFHQFLNRGLLQIFDMCKNCSHNAFLENSSKERKNSMGQCFVKRRQILH